MKPALYLFLFGFATVCTRSTSNSSSDAFYGLAPPVYIVLTQKALTYQADFDTEAWGQMLADSVEFTAPDEPHVWRGKQSVLAGWKHWQQQTGVEHMQLTDLTHLPIQTSTPLPLWDKAGVHVVSYCTARLYLRNGKQTDLLLNVCCHFDTTGHIDRYLMLNQQKPISI